MNGLLPPTKLLAFLDSDWMIFLSVMLGLSWTMGMREKVRDSPAGARQEVVQEWEASVPQEKRATKLFSGPERAGSNGSKRELWFLSGLLHSCKCHEQSQWGLNFTAQARRRQLSFNAEAVRMTYRPAINSSQTQLLCQNQRRWNSQNFSKTRLGHISP